MRRQSKAKKKAVKNEKAGMKRLDGVSSLEGGLVTLFILCACVITVAVSVLMGECRATIWKLFVRCKSCVLQCFKVIRRNMVRKFRRHQKITFVLKGFKAKRQRGFRRFRGHRKIYVKPVG